MLRSNPPGIGSSGEVCLGTERTSFCSALSLSGRSKEKIIRMRKIKKKYKNIFSD